MSEAEQLADKLDDCGIEPEEAKAWVARVQAEAVQKERERVKKILDQLDSNGTIMSPNAHRDILGLPRRTSE
jgi:hypothetical protein